MMPELGNFLLCLAAGLALLLSVYPLWGAARQDRRLMALARPLACGLFACIGGAFLLLVHAFVSYRIMYLHVPAAMWSMGLYLAMAVAAFVGVVWQIKMADLAIAALAPVGAICTLVALVSGAAWGKPMWGTWWIWDARLTSELVLLFLYAGVIALWHAFDDRRLAGRAAGILVLVGVVNLPIIHYSVYWWNTLHQGSTNLQQTIDPSMRLPLRICIFAFLALSVTLTLMRLRNLILQLERRRPWVVALANKGAVR